MKPLPSGWLRAVPDIPRWVETRSSLLRGACRVLYDENHSNFVVVCTDLPLASVVGRPSPEIIQQGAAIHSGYRELLCPPENRHYVESCLDHWKSERACNTQFSKVLR